MGSLGGSQALWQPLVHHFPDIRSDPIGLATHEFRSAGLLAFVAHAVLRAGVNPQNETVVIATL